MSDVITAPRSAPRQWQAILACENNGYWFNKRTMRFFGSRILWNTLTPLADNRYAFISREWSGFYNETPRYTVREWSASGGVDTLGDFNGYSSRDKALIALKAAVRDEAKILAGVN